MKNWCELKFEDVGPERRSCHASFVFENQLYIHGGNDVNEGCLSNMWALDLTKAAKNQDMVSE